MVKRGRNTHKDLAWRGQTAQLFSVLARQPAWNFSARSQLTALKLAGNNTPRSTIYNSPLNPGAHCAADDGFRDFHRPAGAFAPRSASEAHPPALQTEQAAALNEKCNKLQFAHKFSHTRPAFRRPQRAATAWISKGAKSECRTHRDTSALSQF